MKRRKHIFTHKAPRGILVRALRFLGAVVLAALVAFIVGAIIGLAWPMDTAHYLSCPRSGEVLDREGRLMHAFLNQDQQWCFERDLEAFSPRLIEATIAAEDQRFRRHMGVDPLAVLRAAWANLRRREIVSGASTLTMQVVKRANHRPRSWARKAAQSLGAVRLELRTSKDDVLRTYLNTAPYGLNLVGAEAAARRYFGKPARELTLAEAALLAGLPKAPSRLMPLDDRRAALDRRDYVLGRMCDEGYITPVELERARHDRLTARWHAFPRLSPHLATRLRDQGTVVTTLEAATQAAFEDAVKRHIAAFCGEVTNAAAIAVHVPSAAVLARVGSADFFDTPGGGQVDASRAPRSPGSALKPFTYALAIERNALYPCEALFDDSLDYGTYAAENYDGTYRGVVSAADALRDSLNVPAVMVLNRIGARALHGFMRDAGFTTLIRPPEHYGLGLTLGNCEARLEELAAGYTMLANLGEYRALETTVAERTPRPPRRCLSRGVCLTAYHMLEQPLPDEFSPAVVHASAIPPRVCWKTGTSAGHRDAWAFVFNQHYVVGVWMGNNDGRSSQRLVGAEAALPLAARLFRSLPPTARPAWPDVSGDLQRVQVCAVSGLPASPWCQRTKEVLLPRSQYLHRTCDVHRPIRENGRLVVAEQWPGAAKYWDLAHVRQGQALTPHARRERTLRILEPPDQAQFVLTGEPDGDRVRLRASLDADARLYWYVDDHYLGASVENDALLLDLTPGPHTLACMTPHGAVDTVRYVVAN